MSDSGKTEFENLSTPDRQNVESKRGATSQEKPGTVDGKPSNAGDGKPSARNDETSEPSITPSEPGLDADDDTSETSKSKMHEMEKKMMELENQLFRMSQDARNARLAETREREIGLRRIDAVDNAPARLLVAAHIGGTRLIDNMAVGAG